MTFYYFVEASGRLTDFLYPEWGNVRFSVAGDWTVLNDPRDPGVAHNRVLFGPTDRRGQIVTGGGKTVGFGPTPLGRDRLIGADAGAMANRVREIDSELGMDTASLEAAFREDRDDDYHDQSHFNRDFRDFMGMTARESAGIPRALMQAAAIADADADPPVVQTARTARGLRRPLRYFAAWPIFTIR